MVLDEFTPNIEKLAITNAGRACRLTVEAGQATIEMFLGALRDVSTLEYLLDRIDATARTIELITEKLIGWAGGVAEPTVHALAQNVINLLTACGIPDEVGELCLHPQRSAYIRPGL